MKLISPSCFLDKLYANHSDCEDAGQTCHSDAHCVDDKGQLSCVCADGFTGDGVNECKGEISQKNKQQNTHVYMTSIRLMPSYQLPSEKHHDLFFVLSVYF